MRGSIIPEPLAIPPTWKAPAAVRTATAASFGNGSVVMIARAALAPPVADNCETAAGMPRRIASILRFTPMTPVDATRTSSRAQPREEAVSATISRASFIPSGPVHAFAQPLLVMTAWATPLLVASCSSVTSTGAALARLVVNTPAALAGVSVAIKARSGLPDALIPHANPAARNPFGAVTPPSIARVSDTVADGRSRRRRACRCSGRLLRIHSEQLQQHGVLPAGAEQRTAGAIVRDLLGHPGVRHD